MKNKLMMRSIIFLCLILLLSNLFDFTSFKKVYAAEGKPKLNILEIQPGDQYELSEVYFDLFSDYDVNIVQMPMSEFIGKIEKINGLYDIVYIGNKSGIIKIDTGSDNNITYNMKYTEIGDKPKKTGEGKKNGVDSIEYYSENDITYKRARELEEFIESGQLTVFYKEIFEDGSISNSKLVNIFNKYRGRKNFVEIRSSFFENKQLKKIIKNKYDSLNNRPILEIKSKPKEYTKYLSNPSIDRNMKFTFNMNAEDGHNLTARLYLDINGDGLFKEDEIEIKNEIKNKPNGTYTLEYMIPDDFCGLMPWKLEITDESTGVKSYETGATFFKVDDDKTPKTKVLQITPNSGNSFSIKNLSDLRISGVCDFIITEITVNQFNNMCERNQNDLDSILNGKYDMVILGFSDMYYNNVFNDTAIEVLKQFITTGQSVMITHDTFDENISNSKSSSKFTKSFRDYFGQSRYVDPNNPNEIDLDGSKIDHSSLPDDSGKPIYGFTRDSLNRKNSGIIWSLLGIEKTNTTHHIYKINDGMFTQFPYVIRNYLTDNINILNVSRTHFQYFQLNLEDEDVIPWYTLYNLPSRIKYDTRNYYHTYTKGNLTFSGSGHSSPYTIISHELQLFINTMYKAARTANHAPTLEVDLEDGKRILRSQKDLKFLFIPDDIDEIDKNKLTGSVSLYTDNGIISNINYKEGELSLGESKQVTFDLTDIPKDVYSFKIKVQVRDWKGAKAEEIRTIYIKPAEPKIKRIKTKDGVKVKIDVNEDEGKKEIFYDGKWHDYVDSVEIPENQNVKAKQVKEINGENIESDKINRYIPTRELH